MNHKNNKLFLLIMLFLFLPFTAFAGTIDLGQVCALDTDCISGKCGQSTLTGDKTKFCVCDNEVQCETKFKKETGETWTCKPGEAKTKGLPYCLSSTKGIQDPAPNAGTTAPPEAAGADSAKTFVTTPPVPSVKIPGLPDWAPKTVTAGETTQISYIAEYIVAIYKYGLIIASMLAVIMIMIGGIIYLTAAGAANLIGTAKNLIFGAISGIVLLLGSYLLLMIINPNLVSPEAISIQTIEGVEFEDAPDASGAPPGAPVSTTGNIPSKSGDGAVITQLIGPLPASYANCSKAAADFAAKALNDLYICVGPCHCAYTASNFLEYVGCTNIYHGNAAWLAVKLNALGWTAKPLVKGVSRKDLPLGLLYGPGHVGVSLGSGMQFQSSGKSLLKKVNAARGIDCQLTNADSRKDPSKCQACSLIELEKPAGGHYASSTCTTNHGWVRDAIWSGFWTFVIYPPAPGEAAQAKSPCEVSSGGVTRTVNIAQSLCNFINRAKTSEGATLGTH